MSDGDLLADRKRLKRSLSGWRVIAIVALFGALAVLAQKSHVAKDTGVGGLNGYIAEVRVEGIIGDNPDRDEMLNDIRDDKSAKALVVWLDSPGGTTVGGEELFHQLQKVAEKKPVVGVMRTLCASACYMASLGTDHVIARASTLTGSIGVLLESAEISRLADKLGVTPITITSGKYKDVPSLTKPLTDEERTYLQGTINDAYAQFIGMVAQRRGLSEDRVRELADGRVYTGHQALPVQLVDEIGGLDEAKAWLQKEKKLDKDLKLREVKPEPKFDSLFDRLSQWTRVKIFGQATTGLDGLISIWQHSGL